MRKIICLGGSGFVKNKNSEISHWSFCKLLEINCNLLNYTGKYDYKNEYEDEYGFKKTIAINENDFNEK